MENFKISSIFIYEYRNLTQNCLLYYYSLDLNEKNVLEIIDFLQEICLLSQYFSDNDKFILVETVSTYYLSNKYEGKYIGLSISRETKSKVFNCNTDSKRNYLLKLLDCFYDRLVLYNNTLSFLFNPKLNMQFNNNRLLLNDFMINYIDFINSRKLPIIEFLQYFPLSDVEFTNVISSLQNLYEKIPEIKLSSILFKGFLIHNELPLDTISILYNNIYSNINQVLLNTKNLITNEKIAIIEEKFIISLYLKLKFKNKYEEVKFIPYLVEGLLIFLCFNSNVNSETLMKKSKKLEKWVKRYFNQNLEVFNKNHGQILHKKDNINFFYLNHSNKSIKMSSFYLSSEKLLDEEKFEKVNFLLSNCSKNNSSLTNYKQNLFYFNISVEREFILCLNENCTSINQQIEETKKSLFEKIFIL